VNAGIDGIVNRCGNKVVAFILQRYSNWQAISGGSGESRSSHPLRGTKPASGEKTHDTFARARRREATDDPDSPWAEWGEAGNSTPANHGGNETPRGRTWRRGKAIENEWMDVLKPIPKPRTRGRSRSRRILTSSRRFWGGLSPL